MDAKREKIFGDLAKILEDHGIKEYFLLFRDEDRGPTDPDMHLDFQCDEREFLIEAEMSAQKALEFFDEHFCEETKQ